MGHVSRDPRSPKHGSLNTAIMPADDELPPSPKAFPKDWPGADASLDTPSQDLPADQWRNRLPDVAADSPSTVSLPPYPPMVASAPHLRPAVLSLPQPQPRPSITRWLWPLGQLVVGGTVALGLVMGVGFLRSGQQFLQTVPTLFMPTVTEPDVDVRTVVVQQLRGASELTTAIFAMEAVVPAQSDRTLAGYVIGSTNLLYLAYGEVRAGVDLSQITVDDVQLEGESAIRVTLPPPQVLDSKLDLTQSTVYDYDRGWLGLGPDNAPQLQALAQQEALQKIEAAACTTGLLNEANRRAEVTVGQLLATAGFETVTITTQPPAACADPANSDTVIPGQN